MKSRRNIFGKLQYNSPVTLTFALISFLVLLLGMATKGVSTSLLFSMYRAPLTDPFTYIRVFGHVLGHANWGHYTSNMLLFLVLGPMLEEKYGAKAFLKMIVITAVVSGIIFAILYPNSALLGASGIVFMMIILSSVAGMQSGKIPITLLLVMAVYLGNEIMAGLNVNDGIAHMAHIIGGLCGAGFGFFIARKK